MERTRSWRQEPEVLTLRQFPLFNRAGQENGHLEHSQPRVHCRGQELRTGRGGQCMAQSAGTKPLSPAYSGYFHILIPYYTRPFQNI